MCLYIMIIRNVLIFLSLTIEIKLQSVTSSQVQLVNLLRFDDSQKY